MTADETIDVWLELVPDDGARPGTVSVNLPVAPEPGP